MGVNPTRDDIQKRFFVQYVNEAVVDYGGTTRDWFRQITEKLFDPEFGLFETNKL